LTSAIPAEVEKFVYSMDVSNNYRNKIFQAYYLLCQANDIGFKKPKRAHLTVTDILRIIAFIVGLLLLLSGLVDLSSLGGVQIADAISIGGTAILQVIFGIFLMIAGINPDAVRMVIEVFIRRWPL
jgi:hypothetical protein